MRRRRVVAHSVGRLAVALAMGNALGAAMLRHRLGWHGASGAPLAPASVTLS